MQNNISNYYGIHITDTITEMSFTKLLQDTEYYITIYAYLLPEQLK